MISEPAPLPDRERLLDEVLAVYLESEERGEPLSRTELLVRHPDLAVELLAFFADQDRFGSLVSPLCDSRSGRRTPSLETPRGRSGVVRPPSAGQRFGDYELLGEVARG